MGNKAFVTKMSPVVCALGDSAMLDCVSVPLASPWEMLLFAVTTDP